MDPILGIGSTLEVDRGAGFTAIVKLSEISEFGMAGDTVETTNHQSVGGVREYIPALFDPEAIDITGLWVADDTQKALFDDVALGQAQPTRNWRIVLAQGRGSYAFSGWVKEVHLNPQLDDRMEFTSSIQQTGFGTLTTVASAGLTTPFFAVTPNSGVATIVPAPANAVYDYVVNCVTAATTFTVTPTAAAGVIKVNGTVVATGVPSGSINLGAAGSITIVTISVEEATKTPKYYYLDVVRASA